MTIENQPLSVAIIGVGMVADTHLCALSDLAGKLCLKAVLSRHQSSADAFAEKALEKTGARPNSYISVKAMLERQSIDMAILLTPPNARADIVKALADARIPILMEKPIERNSDNAEALVSLCEEAKVPLGIVFQHRVRAASRELSARISADAFGPLGLVEVNVPWWRDQSYYDEPGRGTYDRDGGGVLISQAIHTLDLMLGFTGPVKQVQAMATTTRFHQMESEDYVSASLVFENGAAGSLVASTASFPGDAESIQMYFDKAAVKLKSGVLQIFWRDGKIESHGADASTGGGADPMAFTHEWHRDIIEDFADALVAQGLPLITGREALNVHRLIDALVTSSSNNTIVAL